MNSRLIIPILLLCISSPILCRFKVVAPTDLKNQLNNPEGYPFGVARHGNNPYGSQQLGNIILADPILACSTLQKIDESIPNPIFIVRRGDCTFAQKSRFVQNAGGKMAIIVDNTDESIPPYFGTPNEPDIIMPTIMIEKATGEDIINYIIQNKDKLGYINPQINVKFPTGPYENDIVNSYFWFSSADTTETAYSFLRDISDIVSTIPGVFFRPRFVTWPCAECAASNYRTRNADCLSGGRYCAPDPDTTGPLTGRDVILEDLRQLCIATTDKTVWWSYMTKYSLECYNTPEEGQCGDDVLDSITTSDKVEAIVKCIESSWEGTGKIDIQINDNKLLRQQRELQDLFQLVNFPALIISGKQYYGRLDKFSVINALCENFINAPAECSQFLRETGGENSSVGSMVTVVIVMMIFTVVILFFYRRMIKREMTKEMSIQVSQMVSQYFTLNEEAQSMRRKDGP